LLQFIEALPQCVTSLGKARFIDPPSAIKNKGRQHLETGIMQDAMLDREQNVIKETKKK